MGGAHLSHPRKLAQSLRVQPADEFNSADREGEGALLALLALLLPLRPLGLLLRVPLRALREARIIAVRARGWTYSHYINFSFTTTSSFYHHHYYLSGRFDSLSEP